MKWIAYCTLLLAAAAPGIGQAQQPAGEAAIVKRAADLREQPGEASRSLGALTPQTPVTRLPERAGAWVRVTTAQGASGWLHIFDLTSPNAPAQGGNSATGALRGLTGFFGRGTSAGASATTATSTIGIRGLGAEDIANAQPNLNAVSQAEGLRQDANGAQQFAGTAMLSTKPLVVLPEPPKPRAPANANPAGGQPGNPGMMP